MHHISGSVTFSSLNFQLCYRMMVDGSNEDDGANIEHDIEVMNDEEEVVYDEDDVIHPPIVSTCIGEEINL